MSDTNRLEPDRQKITRERVNPDGLVRSELYVSDQSTNRKRLNSSIEDEGVLMPVLARVEDSDLAVVDGWSRVEAACETNQQVPVWVAEDGEWTDEKALLARLYANTSSQNSELDWLRRAWLLNDYWMAAGDTIKLSPSGIAEALNLAEPTARTWLEPMRPVWNGTIIDRKYYEHREDRQLDESVKNFIESHSIDAIIEGLSPSRLRSIRDVTDSRDELKTLLRSLVRGDIEHNEFRQLIDEAQDSEIPPTEALQKVRDRDSWTTETSIEGDTLSSLTELSETKGIDKEEVVEEAVDEFIDSEGFQSRPEDETSDSVGQFAYLEEQVDGPHPVPDLRMESNEHLSELEEGSVGLTVTSPPYNMAWEYGEDVDDSKGYFDEYLYGLIARTFNQVHEVTAKGGYLCIVVPHIVDVDNADTSTPYGALMAADIADVLTGGWTPTSAETSGVNNSQTWNLYDLITWNKGYNYPGLRDQSFPYPESKLNNFTEAIVVLKKPGVRGVGQERREQSKIQRVNNSRDRDLRDNVWAISPEQWEPQYTDEADTAQFPEELAKRCILHYSYVGDTVLDPFCGRGTVLKMAKQLYRESVGFEIQRELSRDIREYVGIS